MQVLHRGLVGEHQAIESGDWDAARLQRADQRSRNGARLRTRISTSPGRSGRPWLSSIAPVGDLPRDPGGELPAPRSAGRRSAARFCSGTVQGCAALASRLGASGQSSTQPGMSGAVGVDARAAVSPGATTPRPRGGSAKTASTSASTGAVERKETSSAHVAPMLAGGLRRVGRAAAPVGRKRPGRRPGRSRSTACGRPRRRRCGGSRARRCRRRTRR